MEALLAALAALVNLLVAAIPWIIGFGLLFIAAVATVMVLMTRSFTRRGGFRR